MTNSEDELIKRAQSADTGAFCELAARYEHSIKFIGGVGFRF